VRLIASHIGASKIQPAGNNWQTGVCNLENAGNGAAQSNHANPPKNALLFLKSVLFKVIYIASVFK